MQIRGPGPDFHSTQLIFHCANTKPILTSWNPYWGALLASFQPHFSTGVFLNSPKGCFPKSWLLKRLGSFGGFPKRLFLTLLSLAVPDSLAGCVCHLAAVCLVWLPAQSSVLGLPQQTTKHPFCLAVLFFVGVMGTQTTLTPPWLPCLPG